MSVPRLFRLSAVSVVDLVGEDAVKIAQNLTTNDLGTLESGEGVETFVTDVRGKTVGHFVAFRTPVGLRFIGAAGQSRAFINHVERYTIRESCEPTAHDEDVVAVVIGPEASGPLFDERGESGQDESGQDESGRGESGPGGPKYRQLPSPHAKTLGIHEVPWLGGRTVVTLVDVLSADSTLDEICGTHGLFEGATIGDDVAFHASRVRAGFPWYGVDLDESNLPQEADRNDETICFTKGCYLGQETVARLDALGQVQKKLVRWSLDRLPEPGATLSHGGKTVGRITSVASGADGGAIALGFARRSHFDPGSVAEGVDQESGIAFRGEVVGTF